jgi:hypothetical protein
MGIEKQRCCFFRKASLEALRCPSQHPVGQRKLADEAADVEQCLLHQVAEMVPVQSGMTLSSPFT